MTDWVDKISRQGLPRHNLHLLDNGFLSRLYQLEEASHVPDEEKLIVVAPQLGMLAAQQRHFVSPKQQTHLFEPVLDMLCQGRNSLVIPESVLREFYRNTFKGTDKEFCPFIRSEGDGWTWAYRTHEEIEAKQALLKKPWDDRALLFSHFLQERFERDDVMVFPNNDVFSAYAQRNPIHKHIVIIQDNAHKADEAIEAITQGLTRELAPRLTLLSSDSLLGKLLKGIRSDVVYANIATVMRCFCTLSEKEGLSEWGVEKMNDLFMQTYHRNKDFGVYTINESRRNKGTNLVFCFENPDVKAR